jgi:hypothetical protein
MDDFLIMIAPFIVLILSIAAAFWAAAIDYPVKKD